jgi:hypothetical protein
MNVLSKLIDLEKQLKINGKKLDLISREEKQIIELEDMKFCLVVML